MSEIKCPHCGEVFTVDESGYSAIVSQVKDAEFKKSIALREQEIIKQYETKIKLSETETKRQNDKEINDLKAQIAQLKGIIEANDKDKQLEVKNALDQQKDSLNSYQQQIQDLKNQINANKNQAKLEQELAVKTALEKQVETISKKDKQIIELNAKVLDANKDKEIAVSQLKENFDLTIKNKDEIIAYYKDLKTKMSTKLVGETLEQHCQNQFNQLRMTAFPNAYFEKDNDAHTGSKGDYIYRESEDGVEFVSVMFEMKNENDTTATKHKNEDFFKELDKDRQEKGCEYAVLVSMLEADSELYNAGIVDVSYKYPKMYVVRPQCFIPIITLLRNASRNSLAYKKQLIEVKNQNVDISHFEDDMEDFKNKFGKHFEDAHNRFEDAIKRIDDSIKYLNDVKDNLRKTDKHLALANNMTQELTIKKLTKNNPTMREKFDELNNEKK